MKYLFRVGRLGTAPGFLESLAVEEPQSRQTLRDSARRQLSLLEQPARSCRVPNQDTLDDYSLKWPPFLSPTHFKVQNRRPFEILELSNLLRNVDRESSLKL